jgi:hypothetical protein
MHVFKQLDTFGEIYDTKNCIYFGYLWTYLFMRFGQVLVCMSSNNWKLLVKFMIQKIATTSQYIWTDLVICFLI